MVNMYGVCLRVWRVLCVCGVCVEGGICYIRCAGEVSVERRSCLQRSGFASHLVWAALPAWGSADLCLPRAGPPAWAGPSAAGNHGNRCSRGGGGRVACGGGI